MIWYILLSIAIGVILAGALMDIDKDWYYQSLQDEIKRLKKQLNSEIKPNDFICEIKYHDGHIEKYTRL